MTSPPLPTRIASVLGLLALLGPGCNQSEIPEVEPVRVFDFVSDPTPVAVTGPRVGHPMGGYQIVHQTPAGTCIMVIPEPQPYALRPDGSHKLPHEIIRPKTGEAHRLYLHFGGASIISGQDNPDTFSSFIPWSDSEIPAFDHADFTVGTIDTREEVIDAIRRWVQYFYAHNDLEVVTVQPPEGSNYGVMVVGGGPGDLGQPTGVLGISPFDCDKYDRNVSFTFSEDHRNMRILVQTIVHEAGHAYGLAHIANEAAIMNPSASNGEVYWDSGTVPDGQACDGTGQQDSFEVLKEHLGVRTDTIPPWVEIYQPGQDAIVPSSFESLVHGTDNVVLYSVEYFVDGASIAKETLPEFTFGVANLPEGAHQLWAVGEDAHGNTFVSLPIDVSVEANCSALAECSDGLGGVGEPCVSASDCMTGLCAQDAVGMSVCSRICDDFDPCPYGTECTPSDTGDASMVDFYCAGGPAPVHILVSASGYELSGCATARTSPGATALLILLLAGLLAWIRRRR
jgi:MYXO-CTERM domain-containing protein